MTKYAVIENGGKQYRVEEDSTILVDRMPAEVGQEIMLDTVLLLVNDGQTSVGTPAVGGVRVNTTVVGHEKGPKLIVFKYRPKKHYRKKNGHRQQYTRLKINTIVVE